MQPTPTCGKKTAFCFVFGCTLMKYSMVFHLTWYELRESLASPGDQKLRSFFLCVRASGIIVITSLYQPAFGDQVNPLSTRLFRNWSTSISIPLQAIRIRFFQRCSDCICASWMFNLCPSRQIKCWSDRPPWNWSAVILGWASRWRSWSSRFVLAIPTWFMASGCFVALLFLFFWAPLLSQTWKQSDFAYSL